jgi:hypothetical protein
MSAGTAIPEDRFREALARPRCWQAVADAFSVIEEDLQGQEELIGRNLAMRNQVARFLMSVDLHLGRPSELARSRFSSASPKKPMTLAEAYAFVSRLSMAWAALRQRAAA